MKKLDRFKTIQLAVFILFTVICVIKVMLDAGLSQKIGSDPDVRLLSLLLWASLGISFFCIFMDFTLQNTVFESTILKQEKLAEDPLTGLSNRTSIDTFIDEHYADGNIPANTAIVIYKLANIKTINDAYGRIEGDRALQQMSDIITATVGDLGYVGKNSADSYLILFESSANEDLRAFLKRVDQKIGAYNKTVRQGEEGYIEYAWGAALAKENATIDIHSLIASAVRQSTTNKTRCPHGVR